jgi:hypothetical protein
MRILPALLLLLPTIAFAQWQKDGVPVCIASGDQSKPAIVSDLHGGAFVVWEDARGTDPQVYAQHLNAFGVPQWGVNGILVSSGSFSQTGPVAVGDQVGGVIVAWILAIVPGAAQGQGQRLNASGVAQWSPGGIPVIPGSAIPTELKILSDFRDPTTLAAGAILAWTDFRNGITTDIYAGEFDANGTQRWSSPVCTAAGNQRDLELVTDGTSATVLLTKGAILTWVDERASASFPDIYAQRMNSAGAPQWAADGVGIDVAVTNVLAPAIAPAGSQNAIVFWPGPAANRSFGLHADRAGSLGSWGGVTATDPFDLNQREPAARGDDAGGAIVVWSQGAAAFTRDLRAQHLDAAGQRLWATTGVLVSTSPKTEDHPVLAGTTTGGTAIAWLDNRNEVAADVYTQLLDANGVPQWTPAGVPLCTATGTQDALAIAPDTTGGAIVAWTDARNGNMDIYANRITGWGGVVDAGPAGAATLRLSLPVPNPTRAGLALALDLPAAGPVSASVHAVGGRLVRSLWRNEACPAGRVTLAWDGRDDAGARVPAGIYWIGVRAGSLREARRAVVLP